MAGRTVGLRFSNNDRRDLRFFVGPTLIILRWALIGLFFLVSTVQMVAAQSALEPVIPLTAEEQAWLKAHPDITLGYTDVFEPEVITNPDGSHRGILVDFLDELNRRLGTRIRLRIDPIPELLGKAQKRETDGILNILPEYADKLGLLKTEGYMTGYGAVFTRKNIVFDRPSDLAGKKVAIVDKVMFTELIVERYGAGATILKVNDALEGLQRVDRGEADLFLGASINAYFLSKYQLFGLALQYVYYNHQYTGGIAVRPDWPELVTILNKGIASFSKNEINAIVAKWIHVPPQQELIALTPQEQAWLAQNHTVNVRVVNFPPYIFLEDTDVTGLAIDYLNLISKRSGVRFNFVPETRPWQEALQSLMNLQGPDLVTSISPMAERKPHMNFSNPYIVSPRVIFIRKDTEAVSTVDELRSRTLAVPRGTVVHKRIEAEYPDIELLLLDSDVESVRAVSMGKADAYIGNLINTSFEISNKGFINLKVTAPTHFSDDIYTFGIRRDWPELNSIINKALDTITPETELVMRSKWLPVSGDTVTSQWVTLTPKERAWLDQNHTVRVRAVEWPPYLIVKEDGPPQGISVEYLKLIGNRTGIRFKYEVSGQPFAEFLDSMKNHQGPDMTALIVPTAEREQYLSFSEPYVTSPSVIFTHKQDELILDISGLTGKTVAVPRGFNVHQQLTNDYPKIRLSLFESDAQALQALATGRADAYIGNLTAASHIIHRQGLEGLRVAAPSPFGEQALSMGNRSDWSELTTIINKALASITEEEITAIRNKYVALKYEPGLNRSEVLKWVLVVGCGAFGLVLFFVFWNRSLSKKVEARTFELKSSADSLKAEITQKIETEMALKASRQFTDNLIETASVMIVGLDDKGTVNLFNPAAEKITGYTISELHGRNWFELLVPKEQYPQVYLEFSRLMAGGLPQSFHNPILTKTGEERMISWSNNDIHEGDQIAGTLSFGIDITERSLAEEALHESEEKFRYLVEQSPLSIQIFDLDGRIIQVNEAWKKLWGFSEEQLPEVLEKYNVLKDEEGERIGALPLIKKAFKGEIVTLPVLEYDASVTMNNLKVVGVEGNKSWIHARFYPIKNSSGDVVNVVGIEEDITSSIKAEQEILEYQQRLKALASQLTIAEEKERRTIAADLHDHVGHSLALARMQLNGILESDSDLERNILVKDISNIMLQALQDTRSLIFELSSPSMNEIGLGAAISEWLEEQIEKRHGLKTEYSDTTEKEHRKTLDENVRALLFRNVRELLTNVVKHARAKKVSVDLKENANGVTVVIEDDGTGFDPEAVKTRNGKQGGFGLFSIHERMTDLGGTLDIQSLPGKGCRVTLTVPVEKENVAFKRRKSDRIGVVEWWSGGVME